MMEPSYQRRKPHNLNLAGISSNPSTTESPLAVPPRTFQPATAYPQRKPMHTSSADHRLSNSWKSSSVNKMNDRSSSASSNNNNNNISNNNNAVDRKQLIDRQSEAMVNLKLKRLLDLNQRLRGDLARERIYASNACLKIIHFTQNTKDLCVPSVWGYFEEDWSSVYEESAGCCTIF